MSFKEEYSRYQQQIVPDKEFLNGLTEKMERQKQQNQRRKTKARALIISAAALGCGTAAAVMIAANIGGTAVKPPDHANVAAVSESKIDYVTGIFSEEEIFQSEDDISKKLSEILSEEGTVLYKSDKSTFNYEDRQEKETVNALALRVKSAENTEEPADGDTEYYMAVGKEGNVIKFTVTGNILEIKEKKFKLS